MKKALIGVIIPVLILDCILFALTSCGKDTTETTGASVSSGQLSYTTEDVTAALKSSLSSLTDKQLFEDNYPLINSDSPVCKYGDVTLCVCPDGSGVPDMICAVSSDHTRAVPLYTDESEIRAIHPIDRTHLLIVNTVTDQTTAADRLSYRALDLTTLTVSVVTPKLDYNGTVNYIEPYFTAGGEYIVASLPSPENTDAVIRILLRYDDSGVYEPFGNIVDIQFLADGVIYAPDVNRAILFRNDGETKEIDNISLDIVYSNLVGTSVVSCLHDGIFTVKDLLDSSSFECRYEPEYTSASGPVEGLPGGLTGTDDIYFIDKTGIVMLPQSGGDAVILDGTHHPKSIGILDGNIFYVDGGNTWILHIADGTIEPLAIN